MTCKQVYGCHSKALECICKRQGSAMTQSQAAAYAVAVMHIIIHCSTQYRALGLNNMHGTGAGSSTYNTLIVGCRKYLVACANDVPVLVLIHCH